jgi:type II secretory ATPase GspE/PulE/Tfp pilus assembly ATPase PilB-like protein
LAIHETREQLASLDPAGTDYASRFVALLLDAACAVGASDVHLTPRPGGLDVRWRLDGVLQPVGVYPCGEAADVVTRLKVLAGLLTYRAEIPQEGRIRERSAGVEKRVSTFPTLHGERAVVRLFADESRYLYVNELGLPNDIEQRLSRLLAETSGAILVTGPAGSGKSTTLHACLRDIVRRADVGTSIVSLEDPIEVAVAGVAQSQVNEAAGFTLASGVRSLMRQDPEVIMIGEIRDQATAEAAFQASLTGHLVLTTFHAGSTATAISRLSDMGIEPYLLRSGILAILSQRLVRRLCRCAADGAGEEGRLGLPVALWKSPAKCAACNGTGYQGRTVLAELLVTDKSDVGRAILSRSDAAQLESLAVEAGMTTLWRRACAAVEEGLTSPAEVRRVFGFSEVG